MHDDDEKHQPEQRPGGDERHQGCARCAVQEVEKNRYSERAGGPAEMSGIAFRRLVGPRDKAARGFPGGEQGDRDPTSEPCHRRGDGQAEAEIGGRLRYQHVVSQHQHERDDQGGRGHGMRAQDDQRAERLVETPRRRPPGETAPPSAARSTHPPRWRSGWRAPPARRSARIGRGPRPPTNSIWRPRCASHPAPRLRRRARSRGRTGWRCGQTGDRQRAAGGGH